MHNRTHNLTLKDLRQTAKIWAASTRAKLDAGDLGTFQNLISTGPGGMQLWNVSFDFAEFPVALLPYPSKVFAKLQNIETRKPLEHLELCFRPFPSPQKKPARPKLRAPGSHRRLRPVPRPSWASPFTSRTTCSRPFCWTCHRCFRRNRAENAPVLSRHARSACVERGRVDSRVARQ